jgi:hypothetical protein
MVTARVHIMIYRTRDTGISMIPSPLASAAGVTVEGGAVTGTVSFKLCACVSRCVHAHAIEPHYATESHSAVLMNVPRMIPHRDTGADGEDELPTKLPPGPRLQVRPGWARVLVRRSQAPCYIPPSQSVPLPPSADSLASQPATGS